MINTSRDWILIRPGLTRDKKQYNFILPALSNFFGITLQKTIRQTQFSSQNIWKCYAQKLLTTSASMVVNLNYVTRFIWLLISISAISFHDQCPSTTAACAKAVRWETLGTRLQVNVSNRK